MKMTGEIGASVAISSSLYKESNEDMDKEFLIKLECKFFLS